MVGLLAIIARPNVIGHTLCSNHYDGVCCFDCVQAGQARETVNWTLDCCKGSGLWVVTLHSAVWCIWIFITLPTRLLMCHIAEACGLSRRSLETGWRWLSEANWFVHVTVSSASSWIFIQCHQSISWGCHQRLYTVCCLLDSVAIWWWKCVLY